MRQREGKLQPSLEIKIISSFRLNIKIYNPVLVILTKRNFGVKTLHKSFRGLKYKIIINWNSGINPEVLIGFNKGQIAGKLMKLLTQSKIIDHI